MRAAVPVAAGDMKVLISWAAGSGCGTNSSAGRSDGSVGDRRISAPRWLIIEGAAEGPDRRRKTLPNAERNIAISCSSPPLQLLSSSLSGRVGSGRLGLAAVLFCSGAAAQNIGRGYSYDLD